MYDAALDDPIANRLTDDVLGIFLRVEMQFDAYIAQRDTGVRKRETADSCLDHVLPEPGDERVSLISLKASRVRRKGRLELRKRAGTDRCEVSAEETRIIKKCDEFTFHDVKVSA